MKNTVLFFVVAALCGPVWGQTVAIEEALVNKMITEKKWAGAELAENVRIWKEVKEVYPVVPYDTATRSVVVEKVVTFPGVSKAQAFKRVKEWAAIHFGSLDAVTDYEDAESGKIILEGYVPIWYSASFENLWGNIKTSPESRDVLFSMVVTVKDGKAKVRYENLKYRYTLSGYYTGLNQSQYVSPRVIEMPVTATFPIISNPPGTWKGGADLIRKTVSELNATPLSLEKHIRSVLDDYSF